MFLKSAQVYTPSRSPLDQRSTPGSRSPLFLDRGGVERKRFLLLCGGNEQDANRRCNVDHLPSGRQLTVFLIDCKDNHLIRFLVGYYQMLTGGINDEVARDVALGRHDLNRGQRSLDRIDSKYGDAILSPIGGIKKPPRPVHLYLC